MLSGSVCAAAQRGGSICPARVERRSECEPAGGFCPEEKIYFFLSHAHIPSRRVLFDLRQPFRSDPDPVQCFKGGRGPSVKMKPSVPVASVSGRMTKARSAAAESSRLPRSSSQPADRNGGGRPRCLAAHANGFLSPPGTGCLCQPWRSCQSDRATRL